MKAKCSGITLVEAVISTIILAFIAQILVYGFQFVNSQSSAILSKNVQVRDDANSCMEYMLRTLNKRDYQTKKITSEDIAACKEQCKRLTGRDNIEIQADSSDVQLFPDQKIKGYWLTITVKGNSSNTTYAPSAVRDYTVRTLATYYDAAASTSASYVSSRYERRTLDYGQTNVAECWTYWDYLQHKKEIPLPLEQISRMNLRCWNRRTSQDFTAPQFYLPFRRSQKTMLRSKIGYYKTGLGQIWNITKVIPSLLGYTSTDVSFLRLPPFLTEWRAKVLQFKQIRREGFIKTFIKTLFPSS